MADQNYKLRFDFIANNTKFNSAIGVSSNKLKSFGNQMSRTGRILSTRLSLPLSLLGGIAIKQAANFERLQTTLNTLTGSAQKGSEAFERLVRFSAKTPFQLDELVKVNNTLMGFGLNADEAFGSLSMLGDIAGIVGGDLQSIGIAFGQAAAEGRVMTRDLRQFINNGVPILDILAESMSVARGEIMDMASEGKITFDILNQAFKDSTSEGGKFAGGMNTLSQTLNGLFSTLKDNVNIALAELGQVIADALNLKEGIPALSNRIRSVVENFKRLSPETQAAIIKFGIITALVPPLLIVLGTLVTMLASTTGKFIAIGGAIIAANEAIKALVERLTGLKNFNIVKFVGGPLSQVADVLLKISKIKNPFKEIFKLNDPANLPDDFIGPRTREQTFGGDPLLAALMSSREGVDKVNDKGKELAETVNEITKKGAVMLPPFQLNIIAGKILGIKGALLQVGKVLTEIPKKTEPIITQFDFFAMQIMPQIGQAIMQGFNAISQGENPLKRIGTILKGLVTRLLAAAAAAMLLGAFLGGAGGGSRLLKNLGGIKGLFTSFSGIELARGGIVSGPTNALIGEYPGARSNPEVVAPLSKLKTMLGGGAMQGEFVLRGQDLVVALQRAERNRNRFK
jgi:tape measure domain-containing protein